MTVVAVIGVAGLLYCVLLANSVTAWDVLAAALCLAYGVGSLNTVLGFAFAGVDALSRSLVPQYSFSRTMGALLILVGFLITIGRLDRNCVLRDMKIPTSYNQSILTLLAVVILSALVLMATGRIGFQVSFNADGNAEGVSPLAVVVMQVIGPLAALAAYCTATANRRDRILFLISILIILCILLTQGRQSIHIIS